MLGLVADLIGGEGNQLAHLRQQEVARLLQQLVAVPGGVHRLDPREQVGAVVGREDLHPHDPVIPHLADPHHPPGIFLGLRHRLDPFDHPSRIHLQQRGHILEKKDPFLGQQILTRPGLIDLAQAHLIVLEDALDPVVGTG